ncbi:MAG: TIGR03943 family protein [Cyanobacteriota bacterium]|nr:TIGR03943 family protein [Cyanobacteriota bacterium]
MTPSPPPPNATPPAVALPPTRRAALWRGAALALWSLLLLRSSVDGRLDLLLRAAFHPLVAFAGVALGALALAQLAQARPGAAGARERVRPAERWLALATALLTAAVVAWPPTPSFADLASQRPRDQTAAEELAFVLPPSQRSLTDWVRLLRAQPDPRLFAGDPVRISGFVLPEPGEAPLLARLLVRCCLADAAPVGLPVRWSALGPAPPADQWVAIEGVMAVEAAPRPGGEERLVVVPRRIQPIPRPARPLEP